MWWYLYTHAAREKQTWCENQLLAPPVARPVDSQTSVRNAHKRQGGGSHVTVNPGAVCVVAGRWLKTFVC